jgi:hypothetical protein
LSICGPGLGLAPEDHYINIIIIIIININVCLLQAFAVGKHSNKGIELNCIFCCGGSMLI